MRISKLSIKNFRGIRSGDLTLGEFTTLVGANNSGKTTIIEALALLLGRDRLVRTLTEHDFFGSTPARADRISIVGTITHFSPNDPTRHSGWFRHGRAVIKWLDVDTGAVKPASTKPTDLLACQIALSARFDMETLEVEVCRYFFDDATLDDPFDENSGITPLPASLIKELGFFLVPANRTWDRMISFGSELFRRVVSYVGGQPAAAVLGERDRVRAPANPLEGDGKLSQLVSKVNADIAILFGRAFELKLRLTTTDSEGVLDSIVPHFAVNSGAVALPSRRQGNGLISLQTLILLLRFGHLRVERGENFLMAIEEPELHVPPPLQRRLLHHMRALTTQTVITTHSPTVASVPAPHELTLVVNLDGVLSAKPLTSGALDAKANAVQRSLFLSDREATVTAIMQPRVLVPEGKTDANWLRLLCRVSDLSTRNRKDEEESHCSHEVGVIPTKDARIYETFCYLSTVHPSVTCLVDGDQDGLKYIENLTKKLNPPKAVVRWPDGWRIEEMIAWIVGADSSILSNPEVAAAGFPTTLSDLASTLLSASLKTNEIAHVALADAMVASPPCARRVDHVLKVLTAAACGAKPEPGTATSTQNKNGITNVWVFNDAVSGV